jgi:hypothetical protein
MSAGLLIGGQVLFAKEAEKPCKKVKMPFHLSTAMLHSVDTNGRLSWLATTGSPPGYGRKR